MFRKFRIELAFLFVLGTLHAVDANRAAEGWFRLDLRGGRHVLVNPAGKPFLYLGINHVPGRVDPAATRARLQSWGFTGLGYNPDPALIEGCDIPYLVRIDVAKIAKQDISYQFPDVFDLRWQRETRARIAELCARYRDDRRVIGYVLVDTPTIDLFISRALRSTDWVSQIRRLPPQSPGKRRYAAFLAERYRADPALLRDSYKITAADVEAVAAGGFETLLVGDPLVQRDDLDFLGEIMNAYYGTVCPAIRASDEHHLLFSDIYLVGDHPIQAVREAARYVDAIAVQPGDSYTPLCPGSDLYPAALLDRLHRESGKPILIADHQVAFPTPAQPKTIWTMLPDEDAAARATEVFIKEAFSHPYVIGYVRCQYQDDPGKWRGARRGLVSADGKPYIRLLEAHRRAFRSVSVAIAQKMEQIP